MSNSKLKKIIFSTLILILAVFIIRTWQQKDTITGVAPIFIVQSVTGNTISTKPNKNEALLIRFWATWCNICNFENSNIENISKQYKTINIAMQSGSDANIIEYAKQNNINANNIINDNNSSLAKIFGVVSVPTNFIIDTKGNIKFIEVGYSTEIGLRLRLWWAGI